MSRSQKQYLLDILEAIDDARRFAEDVSYAELEDDLRTQYALQRAFEIIGEATKNVDDSIRERYPDVPWRKMAGMRDVIVHKYFAVNLDVVWDTIYGDFPQIRPRLRDILEEHFDEGTAP